MRGLFDLDIGLVDHELVLRGFAVDVLAEVGRILVNNIEAQAIELGLEGRGLRRSGGGGFERFQNRRRQFGRRPQSLPRVELEILQASLAHGGHVGQQGAALVAGHRQGAQFAALDVRER